MILTKSTPFSKKDIKQLREQFDSYIKTVIDIEKEICSAGADRHGRRAEHAPANAGARAAGDRDSARHATHGPARHPAERRSPRRAQDDQRGRVRGGNQRSLCDRAISWDCRMTRAD